MKKILLLLIWVYVSCLSIHAQHRDTIFVHDTIYVEKLPDTKAKQEVDKKLLPVKVVGRYDRGIKTYKFVEKGKWIGGLTFSFVNYDTSNGTLLLSLLADVKAEMSVKSVYPYVGYALGDNKVLGAKLGYGHILGDLGNVDINLGEDMNFELSDKKYVEDKYILGIFYRSYIGLDSKGIFGLFNETELDYRYGKSKFVAEAQDSEELVDTHTVINELQLKINPGVSVFITKNIAAELSFGVAGLKYRHERQTNNQGESGTRRKSGADFRINILNINIGLTVCI